MHLEVNAAVNFLLKILSLKKTLKPSLLDALGKNLVCLLCDKYQGHWYPDNPARGQAFRCIRINPFQYIDESLLESCKRCGIEYSKLLLPHEITLWIDPFEVCGRFGEKADYFIIATFKQTDTEPVPNYSEKETSDYSSAENSSGSTSENSSDDEISEERTTTKDKLLPDEAIGVSNAGTPVDELMNSVDENPCPGSDVDENPCPGSDVDENPCPGSDVDENPCPGSDVDENPCPGSDVDENPCPGSDVDENPCPGSDVDENPCPGSDVDENPCPGSDVDESAAQDQFSVAH
ncbi:hypothetical protein GDO78_015275 [Eleutherodactylus coqui]|uniref:Anti-proliferative protein domain-containing protein n=1 Tax=Eleutherodactylus coqui TaxID=57060 RepID=A0A8J6EKY4_ELECQ|nr:hypothetical protein GDO78_015275 [Eleutherodactylus coqui]